MFRSSNPHVNYFVFDPFRGTRHTFRNLEHACTKEDLFSRGRNGNDLHTSDGERVIYGGAAYGIDGQKRKEREGKGERERMSEKTDIISDRYFAPVARILRSVRDTLLYTEHSSLLVLIRRERIIFTVRPVS